MGDCITFDVLFYLMIDIMHLHMSRLGTLMPEGLDVCFVQQGVKSTEVWHMWFFPGTLIWYYTQTNKQTNKQTNTHTHTHTERHTTHSGASRLTHSYKYIFTPPFICSQQLSVLYWIDNSLINKNSFPRCLFFSTIIHLKRSCLLIRCYKTKFLKSYWCK